jgi:hypothetical protein
MSNQIKEIFAPTHKGPEKYNTTHCDKFNGLWIRKLKTSTKTCNNLFMKSQRLLGKVLE